MESDTVNRQYTSTHMKKQRYSLRGVSADKKAVHKATSILDKGLFPGAFCTVFQDPNSKHRGRGLHADTAGSIPSLATLIYLTTGDLELATNVVINAAVMNFDDVGCIGAFNDLVINQITGINALLFGKHTDEITARIIARLKELCDMLQNWGINVQYVGGETAHVGNNVRSFDVGNSLFFSLPLRKVIDANKMAPGDWIVGLASDGKAAWETRWNSGIGSNGLTSAIHDLLHPKYRRFTETFAPQLLKGKKKLAYCGPYKLNDPLPGSRQTVGRALLSPTRTYLPLLKMVVEEYRRWITGIIHDSGGGQTKIVKFGKPGNVYRKNNLPPAPPIFRAIQEVSGTSDHEMHQVFNMGVRIEIVVKSRRVGEEIISISKGVGIPANFTGRVEEGESEKRQVIIDMPKRFAKPLVYTD